MPNLSATACKTCRAQKLRCSRAIPTCDRCARLDKSCSYPEAPDRKLLAKARISKAKHRESGAPSDGYGSTDESVVLSEYQSTPSDHVSKNLSPRSVGSSGNIAYQSDLIDVYFENMWNAHILLHKPTFLEDLESGRTPPFLTLSLCAAATIFLRPGAAAARAHVQLLNDVPDLHRKGRRWAESAGIDTLSGIDQPSMAHVQACNILDLYWLSAGSPERSLMYSRIAFSAASILKLDESSAGLNQSNQHNGGTFDSIRNEHQRRCFWAIWVGAFIKSDQQSLTAISSRMMDLALPTESEIAVAPYGDDVVTLSMIKRNPQAAHLQRSTSYDTFSELIQLVMIWNSIENYLELRQTQSARKTLPTFIEIDESLVRWAKYLAPEWQYSKRNLYQHLIVKQRPQFVFLHCLNYQCRLVLRSSLVPEFSGLSWNDEDHAELISVSARVAFKTACNISDVASDLIALDCEFGQLPPFIGYCMYASAAIHVLFLFSRNNALSNIARSKLTSNIRVLELMKTYWRCLNPLWNRVTILYNAQASRDGSTPIVKDVAITMGFEGDYVNSELIDESVRTPRSTNLNEPLADSMLKFNMGLGSNSKQIDKIQNFARQGVYQDPLTRFHDHAHINNQVRPLDFSEGASISASIPVTISNPTERTQNDLITQGNARFESQATSAISNIPNTTSYAIDPTMSSINSGDSTLEFLPLDFQDPSYWMDIDFSELNQTMLNLDQDATFASWWNDSRTY